MLVFSDLHLDNHTPFAIPDPDERYPGCNSRAVAILKAVEHVLKAGFAAGHRNVVLPGDVFHRRTGAPTVIQAALGKLFEGWTERGMHIYVLPGNHDYADKIGRHEKADHVHSTFSLRGTVPISGHQVVRMLGFEGDVSCLAGFVPFTASKESWIRRVERLWKDCDLKEEGQRASLLPKEEDKPKRILFAHQSFVGALTGPHEWVMKEGLDSNEIPGEWDLILSGHYHRHQVVGAVVYVGGLLQHNFGERDYVPGWLVVDPAAATWEHVENTFSPRFVRWEGNDLEAGQAALEAAKKRGDYIMVRWSGNLGDSFELSDTARDLTTATYIEEPDVIVDGVRLEMTGAESPLELLGNYVAYREKEGETLPAPSKELLIVGLDILETSLQKRSV